MISRHELNIWGGRILPLITLGALGYSVYVITYEIASEYFKVSIQEKACLTSMQYKLFYAANKTTYHIDPGLP
jgi:hypothetical protein